MSRPTPRWRLLGIAVALTALLTLGAKAPDKLHLVIIYPGGPSVEGEGAKLIEQFSTTLAEMTGLSSASLKGVYFNQLEPAEKYLAKHKDAFIMGSLGFYLSRRAQLGLKPLARMMLTSSVEDRYFLMVHKGRYTSLDQLKGKSLTGSVLADDPRFLSRLVFEGKLEVKDHFTLKPTNRPLSAVRKVARDKIDAVLLNNMQHSSLKALPVAEQLEVLHQSPGLPSLGLMMVDTPTTRKHKENVVKAVSGMCDTDQGKPICTSFGFAGFAPLRPDDLATAVAAYDKQ